jgi:hypothetical protein
MIDDRTNFKLSKETMRELVTVQGELMQKERRHFTYEGTLQFLIGFYRKHKETKK